MKKSKICFMGSFIGILSIVGMANHQTSTGEYMGDAAAIVGAVSLVFLPILGFVFRSGEKRKEYRALTPEARARVDADRERKVAEAQEKMDKWKADNTIVSTAIVNSTTIGKQKASVTSSIVRGAVGGAIFGPVGLVAGAVTPKKKTITTGATVTFAILYESGKRSVETVKVGSKRYNELAKYIA